MLFACIGLVAALVHSRRSRPSLPKYFLWQDMLMVSPLDRKNVWIIDQPTMDSDLKTILSRIKSSRQNQIQVLSMRGLVIRDHIQELWPYLPNLAIVDAQNAQCPDQFWFGLEQCKSLDHALAHGALQPSDLKAIHIPDCTGVETAPYADNDLCAELVPWKRLNLEKSISSCRPRRPTTHHAERRRVPSKMRHRSLRRISQPASASPCEIERNCPVCRQTRTWWHVDSTRDQ